MDLLNGGDKDWGLHSPYRDMGYRAFAAAAKGAFSLGSVGAGTGATTATVKGGLGSASAVSGAGHRIAALVAVNAMGTPTIGDGAHFWAGPFEENDEFGGLGMPSGISPADRAMRLKGVNITATTIGAVVTDAIITKAEAHRLSIMAQDGLARAVLPAHLPFDGDTVFAASTGARPMAGMVDFFELCHLATTVMARAIARGVYEATALPYQDAQPAWSDRFGERRDDV
jgi:L-aminopeptidase/D-esterase-like protein